MVTLYGHVRVAKQEDARLHGCVFSHANQLGNFSIEKPRFLACDHSDRGGLVSLTQLRQHLGRFPVAAGDAEDVVDIAVREFQAAGEIAEESIR